jgi:hypothetical protein
MMTSPYFPLDLLKQLIMENLTEAVEKGAAHIRDPIGGSNEDLFVYVFALIFSPFCTVFNFFRISVRPVRRNYCATTSNPCYVFDAYQT